MPLQVGPVARNADISASERMRSAGGAAFDTPALTHACCAVMRNERTTTVTTDPQHRDPPPLHPAMTASPPARVGNRPGFWLE